jgi:hypothetical protein
LEPSVERPRLTRKTQRRSFSELSIVDWCVRLLLVHALSITDAAAQELGPGRHWYGGVQPFWQRSPKLRMMPTEFVPTGVPVHANACPTTAHLFLQLLTAQALEILSDFWPPVSGGGA